MEAGTRQLGLGAGTKQWLLIFAAAAAITAVLFGLLFEGTAHLTAWVLSLGRDGFEKIHPGLRFWITVGPALTTTMVFAIAISFSQYRKKARATPVRRRKKTLL
jgi:hypothetical protein